jgi:PAS domain S-box-containing protein
MLAEALQEKAILYVSGAMEPAEREDFEVLLEYQMELRAFVADLQDVTTAVDAAENAPMLAPPDDLKARIFWAVARPSACSAAPEALVVADPLGRIEWVCAGFSAMCGYTLPELRGRRPGEVLQGPETDPAAVWRIREALRSGRMCRETLVNYHKQGTPYRVDIRIGALRDDDGRPLAFVARERKLVD